MRVFCGRRSNVGPSVLTFLVLFVTAVEASSGNGSSVSLTSGLVVTTPQVWLAGSVEKTCITSHAFTFDVLVNISLISRGQVILSSTSIILPPGGSKCAELHVPRGTSESTAKLEVNAKPVESNEAYSFSKSADVTINTPKQMTFIQTDKPQYKPGDVVRIRIITLKGPDLLLLTEDISLAFMEDPSRTRVMQWANISNIKGIASLEMQLSDQPRLGEWTIKALIHGQTESQKFAVEEYVLPKYEVTIEHPSHLFYKSSNLTWKVCARYTYGQPVAGNVTSSACIQRSYGSEKKLPCLRSGSTQRRFKRTRGLRSRSFDPRRLKKKAFALLWSVSNLKDGCAEFSFNSTSLKLHEYRWGEKLDFFAQVKELGTNVRLNTTFSAEIHQNMYRLTLLSDESGSLHYKPGLPFYGWGKVTFTDETPVEGKVVKIQTNGAPLQDLELTTNADGTFRYILPGNFTGQDFDSIEQKASIRDADEEEAPVQSRTLKAWYSAGKSFLQIEPFESVAACRSTVYLPVIFLTPMDKPSLSFHFQLIARGDIVHAGQLSASPAVDEDLARDGKTVYKFNVTFVVTHRMSGSLKLLVFTALSDGEIVADSLLINVKHCFNNHVSMKFADQQKQPGHSTVLSVAADPDSLCSVLVVDKSVKLMSTKDSSLSKSKVFQSLKQYDISPQKRYGGPSEEDCGHINYARHHRRGIVPFRSRRQKRMIMRPDLVSSKYVDSKEAFVDSGMIVLSDLRVATRPCTRLLLYHSYSPMFAHPMRLDGMKDIPEARIKESAAASMKSDKGSPVLHRTFFPESWLWQLKFVGDTGVEDVSVTVPHTITEWVGSGFCTNTQTGLGVSSPFTVNAFQPFFVSFTVPYSVIRGERVAIPVSVFNYLHQCLKVTLYVQKSSALQLSNDSLMKELTVCGHETETYTYNVVPRELGNINFTIRATSVASDKIETNSVEDQDITTAADIVTQMLLVEAEGKEEELTKSAFVCASGNGTWSIELPDDSLIVPDSLKTYTSIIGDVMGPTLTGLESLLALPTGCGEQNMLKFSPNIFVMQYLQKTNSLTEDISSKATGFLQTGYQRELTYRHRDGSYSAFGESDKEGSIWLTAFVIKSFAQARPFIHIDQKDLEKSIKWITSTQLENGCFPQVGRILHKEMKGGLADNEDSLTALTAYIVVALLEAGMNSTDPVIVRAIQCLNIQHVHDVYTQSLMLYAYTMWDNRDAKRTEMMQLLQSKAVVSDAMKHWNMPSDGSDSSPATIEMTSYVLLSTLHGAGQDVVVEANQIVRWLTTQRNSLGGFSSTQDTVLALQALAQFAALVHSDNFDARVAITGTAFDHSVSVTNGNRLLLQKREGRTLPSSLQYNVTGTGCVLLQASVKYNTIALQGDEEAAFVLTAEVQRQKSNSCKERSLKICARYNGADNASNMAVVSVKMVSGWIPDKDSIKKLTNYAHLKLKRFEIDKNLVQLYFEELDRNEKCLTFHVHQNIIVTKTKPVLVHVYDYYHPSLSTYTKYSITSTCGTKEEIRDNGNEALEQKNGTISQMRSIPKPPKLNNAGKKNTTKVKKPPQTNCPACDLHQSTDLKNRYCNASNVYEVLVVNKTAMTIQTQTRSEDNVNKTVSYHLPGKCKCTALGNRRGVSAVLVLTNKVNLRKNRISLKLNADATVIESSRIKTLVEDAAARNTTVCP